MYVTHRAAGNRQTEWQLQWKAPDSSADKVTFYASVLASNNSGTNQGDQLYTTSLTVDFAISTHIKKLEYEPQFRIYPMPASDLVFVENLLIIRSLPSFLINNKGTVVLLTTINPGLNQLDISHLPSGIYFLQIKPFGIPVTKKIIIQ